ncbi:MAG TPA: LysR family transcriptional regulator, partial [Polyangiaceae bacterium]|nr:LysR family transcriptional regulator [Polyangiaceae bacterium]
MAGPSFFPSRRVRAGASFLRWYCLPCVVSMDWLNYHHLYYFWRAARLGSVTQAARELRLAQPTISGQIRLLEQRLGAPVFARRGRNLELTDTGRMALRYAEDIFTLGRELLDVARSRPSGHPLRLVVGVADVLPKVMVHRLLEPAFGLAEPIRLICYEDETERLLASLAVQRLDLVLSDAPLPPSIGVRAFHHLLGESPIAFFAARPLARKLKRDFPRSLDGAPLLVPTENTALRRALDQWFHEISVRPRIIGEIADSALC